MPGHSEQVATQLLVAFTAAKLAGYKDDVRDVQSDPMYHYRSNEAAASRAVDTLERWLVHNGYMITKIPDLVYVGGQRGIPTDLPARIGGPDQPGVSRLGGAPQEINDIRVEVLRLAEILHVEGTDTRGWPPYRILTEVVIPAAREAMDMTRSQDAVIAEYRRAYYRRPTHDS